MRSSVVIDTISSHLYLWCLCAYKIQIEICASFGECEIGNRAPSIPIYGKRHTKISESGYMYSIVHKFTDWIIELTFQLDLTFSVVQK